jgi:hypothetical protein
VSVRHGRSRSGSSFRVFAVMVAVALGLAGPLSSSAHAADNDVYRGATTWELLRCATNWDECQVALDAQNWALSVTHWKYPGSTMHNDRADSFRHCIWTGAMAQRLGYERAGRIAAWHEVKEGQPTREYDMDVANNAMGLMTGSIADQHGGSDTWGWIMDRCQRYERTGQLHGLGGVQGQYSPE